MDLNILANFRVIQKDKNLSKCLLKKRKTKYEEKQKNKENNFTIYTPVIELVESRHTKMVRVDTMGGV